MTRLNLARFTPKVQPSPPALAPPPRRVRSRNAPAPVTTLGRPLLAISDAQAPPPSLALAFVGKQLLGFESKSRWLGSDVLLRGSRDQSQIVRSQPIRALRASPSSTRSGTTCGSQHLQIGGSGGPRPRVSP